jgi:hypothetical protein
VSSGDHVLWILGDVQPLPRKLKWRARKFERLLADSQEVILHVPQHRRLSGSDARVLVRTREFTGGHTLKEVISPELYERVVPVWKRFGSGAALDDQRPAWLITQIANGMLRELGLRQVSANHAVEKLARSAGVVITRHEVPPLACDWPLTGVSDEDYGPNLERLVGLLEDGGKGLKQLANAWSLGDIDALRQLVPQYGYLTDGSRSGPCSLAPGGQKQYEEHTARRNDAWLALAERALLQNASTIALVPMPELFARDGYLAGLRARGYEIVEPQ